MDQRLYPKIYDMKFVYPAWKIFIKRKLWEINRGYDAEQLVEIADACAVETNAAC